MLKSKRGQAPMTEILIGLVVGIMVALLLITLTGGYWSLFFESGRVDTTTLNTFDLVVNDLLDMKGLGESERTVNVQFEDSFSMVAFGKSTLSVGECRGLEISRPSKNCEGACICLCENEFLEDMCNSKNVICRDFSQIDLDFEGSCNLVDGTGKPQSIQLIQKDNMFVTV